MASTPTLAKLAGVLLLASSLPAFAGTVTLETTGVSDPVFGNYPSASGSLLGWGGEFAASEYGLNLSPAYNNLLDSNTAAGEFVTFCIELNQDISTATAYNYTVSTSLNFPSAASEALTIGTAFLYSQFVDGTLSGYTPPTQADLNASAPTSTTPADAAQLSSLNLQDAFWDLQGETLGTDNNTSLSLLDNATSLANPFIQLVAQQFGGGGYEMGVAGQDSTAQEATALAGALVASNGAYGVQVLNLVDGNGTPVQNQLVMTVPDSGSTLALIGAAFFGLMALRRRLPVFAGRRA
jgi:hypothetical protein